jgi:CDP-diacylglycerol--glycerol-3-phosphate 3-phosphatidyltransferase
MAAKGRDRGAQAADSPPLLNIANGLTVARLLLVPAIGFFLAYEGGGDRTFRIIAAALFALAALTDHWDGHLARSRGLVTDFGKIADPIVDKALTLVTLGVLSWLGELSWWVTGIIAFREIGVTLLRFAVIKYAVIPASMGGKIKTVTQVIAIGLYILPITSVALMLAAQIVMIVAVALTIATGAEYTFQVATILSAARAARASALKGA